MPTKPPVGWIVDRTKSIASGLVAVYALNEGSGTIAHDSSGHGNDGTITPGAGGWITGPNGAAIQFDGTDTTINCGTGLGDALAQPTGGVTVMIGFKFTSGSNNGLFSIANPETSQQAGVTKPDANNLNAQFAGASGALTAFNDTVSWHNVVGQHNGTNNKLWLDGVAGTDGAGSTPSLMTGCTTRIGEYYSAGYRWNGAINFVYVWARALTPAEVALLTANPFALYAASIPSMHFPGSLGSLRDSLSNIYGSVHGSIR